MESPPSPHRTLLRYDAVLKDLFQRDHPTLLKLLSGGIGVKQTLNVELAIVEERRADLLFELEDQSLFLLDFQSTNDRNMGYRVGIYTLVGAQKYKRKVRATVLYTGMPKMRMEAHVDAGSTQVNYSLLDIREISAETLMSGGPGDLALALLARGGAERMREILARVLRLKSPHRERLLAQLAVLAGLRRLDKTIRMEMKKMGAYVDIQKNAILKDIYDEGTVKGASAILTAQLKEKFGPLPAWATTRLRKASMEQILAWSRMLLSATTLQEVVGRR